MAGEFAEIADRAHRMSVDLAKSQEAAKGIDFSFVKLAASLGAFDAIKHALVTVIKQTTTYQSLSHVISAESRDHTKLMERQIVNETALKTLQTQIGVNMVTVLTEEQMLKEKGYEADIRAANAQARFLLTEKEVGGLRVGLATSMVALTADLLAKSRQFNQNLIEANASLTTRYDLLARTLRLQTEYGVSFDRATESARALVHYGMDTEKSYAENVRIVTQMEQGLAVSAQTSAMLATIVERQVHGSFSRVADVVAQLVDDTSLAGNEAAKLATNIALAMGRLHPGMGAAALPEIVKLVGRYEGALKEVGGAAGGFEQLVTKLTTTEGMVGAGALGVNPDFLATERGVQTVMDRFAQFGERLVGQSQGWERQMRLDMLGQMFNTSAEQANQMLIAIRRANDQQVGNISLQERWRNQLAATGQGFDRLYNTLTGLLQGALLPVVTAVNYVANAFADLLNWVLQFRPVAVAGMVLVGVAGLSLVGSMIRLGAALWQTVLASNFAIAAQQRLAGMTTSNAIRQMALNFGPGGGAAAGGAGSFGLLIRSLIRLPGTLFSLINPFTVIAAALVGFGMVWMHIWRIQREMLENQKRSDRVVVSQGVAMRQTLVNQIGQAAATADVKDQGRLMDAAARLVEHQFHNISDPNERLKQAMDWLAHHQDVYLAAQQGVLLRVGFKERKDVTSQERALAEKTLLQAEKLSALMEKALQSQLRSTMQEIDSAQAEELHRSKEMSKAISNAIANPIVPRF